MAEATTVIEVVVVVIPMNIEVFDVLHHRLITDVEVDTLVPDPTALVSTTN